MRSHTHASPPPAPAPVAALLATLAARLPSRRHQQHAARAGADAESRALVVPPPPRRREPRHVVRVQGRLAPVRSVSAAGGGNTGARGRGAARGRRRRSAGDILEGGGGAAGGEEDEEEDDDDDEQAAHDVARRDAQLRGYGIGGRGNIRRPTEAMGSPSPSSRSSSRSLSSLWAPSGAAVEGAARASPSKRWSVAGLWSRVEALREG